MEQDKKLFLKALKSKFNEDPNEHYTNYYCYGGWEQSPRKKEFNEYSEKLVKERGGLPFYNPDIGVPLGQRKLMSYKVSGTDSYVEGDDLHFCNNSAIQQLSDDIKRTIIVGAGICRNCSGPSRSKGRCILCQSSNKNCIRR